MLEVNTAPSGARVIVDGREVQGATPLTVPELSPGVEHTVIVREPDHIDETFTFVGAAGRVESRSLTLRERPLGPDEAWVEVVTEPANARVHIGDRDYTAGSPYRIRTRAQAHSVAVTVMAPGFDGETRAVRIAGGQTVNLRTVRLTPAGHEPAAPPPPPPPPPPPRVDATPAHLRVGATPGATSRSTGAPYGQTPQVNITLAPGSHRIVCASPDAPTRTRSVTLTPGQQLSVVFSAQ